MISLLDTANATVTDWYVVFRNLPPGVKKSPLWKLLKPGFEHVEIWRYDRGIWIRLEPCWEFLRADAHEQPPWEFISAELAPTVVRSQRVVPIGRLREPFAFGPGTCVESVKGILGLRAFFARTPWQLYKALKKDKN